MLTWLLRTKRLMKRHFEKKEKSPAMLIVYPPMTNCGVGMSTASQANLPSACNTHTVKSEDFTVATVLMDLQRSVKFLSVLPHRHKSLGEKIEFSLQEVFRTCILFLKLSFFIVS